MAHNEATARARILTVIKTVSDYGKAYDYERWAKNWTDLRSLFMSTISNENILRGWTVTLASMEQDQQTFGAAHGDGSMLVKYVYRIRAFQAVKDDDASEKAFHAKVLAVIAALDADGNLHTANYEGGSSGYFVSEACVHSGFDYRMFAGVLCHFAEITKEVMEMV